MSGIRQRDHRGLTPTQARFVDAYTGCQKETAKLIGTTEQYAKDLMSKPENAIVRQLIWEKVQREREAITGNIVASRLERLTFWTEVMRTPAFEMKDRLKASEILGKAHMDFVEKHIIEGGPSPVQVGVVRGLDERVNQILGRDWLE